MNYHFVVHLTNAGIEYLSTMYIGDYPFLTRTKREFCT